MLEENVHISEVQSVDHDTINRIVNLHQAAFPSFFLTQLGSSFLRTLYSCYIKDPSSGIIAAYAGKNINGFIAYSFDYSGFYRRLVKKHLLRFAFCSLAAVIRHPSFTKRLLRAFQKSESVKKETSYVELASICTDPNYKNHGIGTSLIDYLKGMIDYTKYSFISLETDAVNNEEVNRFYQNNGFKLARQYKTAEGRLMNEYRFERTEQ